MTASIWSLEYLIGGWQLSFHDDHFVGWLITGSYLLSALLAGLIASFHNHLDEKHVTKFWNTSSLLMVLLGINKQLALQTLLIETGKQIANVQGWYDKRRIVQFLFR